MSSFKKLYDSLLFWPAVISVGFVLLAFGLIALEGWADAEDLLPFFVLADESTIRALLGALVGALITLVVFSFTMMMTIYNQAATNYSPRVIASFISQRSYQIVLGYYLGTITYLLIVLYNVGGDNQGTHELAALFAVVLGVASLGVFVYFLNSVSQSVLVSNIMLRELEHAYKTMKKLPARGDISLPSNLNHEVLSPKKGYMYDLDKKRIASFAKENEVKILISAPGGQYSTEDGLIALTDKPLTEDQKEEFLKNFSFHQEPSTFENFESNMRSIEEIAVKALSPGINDPGTAVIAIDYLIELFVFRSKFDDVMEVSVSGSKSKEQDDGKSVYIKYASFKDLLDSLIGHLSQYAEKDEAIDQKVLASFGVIKKFAHESVHADVEEVRRKRFPDSKSV